MWVGGIQLPAVAWAAEEPEATAPSSSEAPEAPGTAGTIEATEATGTAEATEPEAAEPSAPAGAFVLPMLPGLPGTEAPRAPQAAPSAAVSGSVPEAGAEAEAEATPEAEAEAETAPSPVLGEPVPASAETVGAAEGGAADGPRPGRVSKPVVAAALVGGLVLVGLPLVLSQLGGGGPQHGPDAPPPAGMNRAAGGPDGFVPGFDDRGNAVPEAGLQAGNPSPGQGDPNAAGGAAGDAGTQNSVDPHMNGSVPQGGSGPASGGTGSTGGGGSSSSGSGGGGGSTGGGGTGGGAQPPAPGQPNAGAPPAAAKTYQAVAGAGCSGSGTGYSQNGWFDDGQAGWKTYSGGWGGDGCNGRFTAIPMSGAPKKDNGNYALWTFRTGQVSTGRCQVSVYIPNNKDIKAVGGAPAYYTVQNSLSAGSGTISSFNINQRTQLGSWYNAGTYDVRGGQFAVMLHDRGQDWTGSGDKTYAHNAAAAVRVSCTA
ncbi:hypothetical protein [Streptomyces sp. NPDC054961]